MKHYMKNNCVFNIYHHLTSQLTNNMYISVYESYNMTLATLLVSESTHLVLFSINTMKNNATYLFLNEYI